MLVGGHEGDAAAGQVIESFGAFVIDGNFKVGLFVFVTLLIINMIVKTKGASRVSEVSARFTLGGPALGPPKKSRRSEVSTEADFYRATDGCPHS
ncbi:MAG: FHIPEP family type III secretion protein [Pontixanthobacter sp.]